MKNIVTPFRVGLLVLASAIFLFIFITFVKKGGLSEHESIQVYAYFRDASGLSRKSKVLVAGINVGEISDIALVGNRAKVTLRIKREVGLRQDAVLTKRSESLLGDYVLDLFAGSETAPLMPDGGEIIHVIDTQGMEAVFGSLEKITSDIQQVTSALRETLGGQKGANSLERIVDNLTRLSDTVRAEVERSGDSINDILGNVQGVSRDVRSITEGEDQNIRVIVENIRGITHDIREVMGTVKGMVGSNEGELKESVSSLKQSLDRLDQSLANIQEVTEKVKNGQGALGKLVADERLGQKLGETVEDLSNLTNTFTQIKMEVSLKSEYLLAQGSAKDTLGIRMISKPDKYYLLEVVDDPRGSTTTNYVQNNPPGAFQPTTQIQTVTGEGIKISAEFAKRFYFTTLRFGLIESTGGVGVDLHFLNDAVTLKTDAFNFSVQQLRYPRLRTTLQFNAFQHLFLSAGMDDILNNQVRDTFTNRLIAGRDYFVGGGVYFTDDDLKAILAIAPKLPGM